MKIYVTNMAEGIAEEVGFNDESVLIISQLTTGTSKQL